MRKKVVFLKIFCLFTVCLLLIAYSLCHASAGRVQGEFLRIGVSGRPAGMGEAFCAVADNANAVYWNPAGLVQLKGKELSATHTNLLGSIRIANLVYGQVMGGSSAFGAEVNALYVEDVRRDEITGNETGTFTDYNASVALVYSCAYKDNLLIGAGLKALQFQLDTEKASGVALDIGTIYKISGDKLKAGLVIQNIGTQVQFQGDDSAPLATNAKLGVCYRLKEKGLVASDINVPADGSSSISIGGEYYLSGVLTLRGGYKITEGGNTVGGLYGASIGVGINIKSFSLDYAFVPFGDFENMNRVSLSMRF